MQCTCREDLEKKLLARFKEDNPDSTEHRVELTGYALIIGERLEQYPVMKIKASHVVTAKNGNQREKKVEQSMICSYCPFCGKPAKDGAEEKQA